MTTLNDGEHVPVLSPDERRERFFSGLDSVDPRAEQLPYELIDTLQPDDAFSKLVQGGHEPLLVTVARTSAGQLSDPGQAYHGAVDAGVLGHGADFGDFKTSDVVTIYSEPHGGHTFAYDALTGVRFLPRGNVSHVDTGIGARQIVLGNLLDELLPKQQ